MSEIFFYLHAVLFAFALFITLVICRKISELKMEIAKLSAVYVASLIAVQQIRIAAGQSDENATRLIISNN